MSGLTAAGGALDGLIIGGPKVGGNIRQISMPFDERKTFRAAPVKGEDAGFGQERPAAIVQRAGVGIVAMRADLDFGKRLRANDVLQRVELFRDLAPLKPETAG